MKNSTQKKIVTMMSLQRQHLKETYLVDKKLVCNVFLLILYLKN